MSADRYRRWFEYEKDVNAKVLWSIQAVPPSVRDRPEFQRAVDLMMHMTAARRMWLYRFGVIPAGPTTVDELEPHGCDPALLPEALRQVEEVWSRYLETLTDAELSRRFEYRALEGRAYSNTVEDVLTQLFGHGWYHRGQIAVLLRSIDSQPASTDFILWAREAADVAKSS
ncbi:MAG TPA: DinB family protein [Terriglobales bacterium]|nr:DinB family protein [Terriglobales bacterium]